MLGAIFGDIVGSTYEHMPFKSIDFPLFSAHSHFTDDTVLTVATMDALLHDGDFARTYHEYGNRYPRAGYGSAFRDWLRSPQPAPYGSWGNGSAMRVSPVAHAFATLEEVLEAARATAIVTHDHPEGIKGAQAVALAVFRARARVPKEEIRQEITERFGYDLDRTIEDIRPMYTFDVSCQGSVPESLMAFFESTSVESAVRLAVSLGGDADTQASIAGAIAEAWYGELSEEHKAEIERRLPDEFLKVIEEFSARFGAAR